ncbi:MAG TPA: WD40 repeat domain-containing protein [Abditibacteriaceae bacterium]|jgi:WD40 repeat protein
MLRHWQAHHGPINGLGFSPQTALLASGGGDGAIMLWSLDDDTHRQTLIQSVHEVTALSIAPTGALLAADYDHG